MARKPRDHKAEYQARKAAGLARGLSVSQARGHARKDKGEQSITQLKAIDKLVQKSKLSKWRVKTYKTERNFLKAVEKMRTDPKIKRVWLTALGDVKFSITLDSGELGPNQTRTLLSNRFSDDLPNYAEEKLDTSQFTKVDTYQIRYKNV